MAYMKRSLIRRTRNGFSGLGYSDDDQCSTIPTGDPYRKPGNYCATPDGGMTTFNADGSTYRQPGYTVDPDPAHPVSGRTSSSGGGDLSFWEKAGAAIGSALGTRQTPQMPIIAQPGMSTTTMVAIAGGAVLLAVLLARR